jgi:hypothetical protein
MTYDIKLADRIRDSLYHFSELKIEEKKMFRGLCFMVNGKMCQCKRREPDVPFRPGFTREGR